MPKLSETITTGLASARNGRQQLKQVLTEEWRAIRTTQQDRAHLATVADAPSTQRIHFEPAVNTPDPAV